MPAVILPAPGSGSARPGQPAAAAHPGSAHAAPRTCSALPAPAPPARAALLRASPAHRPQHLPVAARTDAILVFALQDIASKHTRLKDRCLRARRLRGVLAPAMGSSCMPPSLGSSTPPFALALPTCAGEPSLALQVCWVVDVHMHGRGRTSTTRRRWSRSTASSRFFAASCFALSSAARRRSLLSFPAWPHAHIVAGHSEMASYAQRRGAALGKPVACNASRDWARARLLQRSCQRLCA